MLHVQNVNNTTVRKYCIYFLRLCLIKHGDNFNPYSANVENVVSS